MFDRKTKKQKDFQSLLCKIESSRNEHKSDPVDKVASSFAQDCYMKLLHGIQEGWITLIN